MAKYHVEKQTRLYDGRGYDGFSCSLIDHLGCLETNDLAEAKSWVQQLQSVNPVGWNIWDSETGDLVDGFNHFSQLISE